MMQFLSSYPWRYYLKTFFRKARPARGVLLVKEDRVSILSPVGRKLVFSSGLRELKGAPSLTNSSRPGLDTAFRREALADRSINHSFEWIFVIDIPDLQIHQIDSLRYGSTRDLTSRRVMELVPSVLKADLAHWELVNSKLEPIEQDMTPVCILLGMPNSVIRNLESWSRHLRSTVSAILPLALVLLEQSITLSPTAFHVVFTTNHTVIALTQDGEIRLITRVDPITRLGATQIDAIIGSFGDTFPEIAQHPARFISSDLSSAQLEDEAKNFSIPVVSTSHSEFLDLEDIVQGYRAAPVEAFILHRALCLVPPNPYH
jgi:hypothetical protein